MPFRALHEVVGKMVRSLLAQGRDFSDLTLEEWRAASEVFGPDAPQAATAPGLGEGPENAPIHQPRGGPGRRPETGAWAAARLGLGS
jgi:hypothetical protein